VVCLAPRAPGDSVRRSSDASARPLNFTVRRPAACQAQLSAGLPGRSSLLTPVLIVSRPRQERQLHSVTFLHLDLLSSSVNLPAGVNRAAQIQYRATPVFHLAIQGCNSNVYTHSYLICTCARMFRA
jgi:hypothetical protein